MKTHILTVAAFAAACLAGSTAYAGPTAPAKKIVEPTPESCITGDIGFDVVSEYITKGIVQQNQGFIIQPYADLHFRIFKGAGALTSITADVGIWNSFQGHRNVVSTTPGWYEFDFQTGLTFNFNKLSLGGYFKDYSSPSDQFQTCYAIGISLAYDDSAALGNFALHPYGFAELNVQGTTGNNTPAANGFLPANAPLAVRSHHARGQYYEVGIAPGHTWGPVTLSLPISAGFGSGGFYLGNRGFGFIGVGVKAAYELKFVPACLGKWSISSGFTYYRLGGNNSGLASTRVGSSGSGGGAPFPGVTDKNELVFQGGLKVAF